MSARSKQRNCGAYQHARLAAILQSRASQTYVRSLWLHCSILLPSENGERSGAYLAFCTLVFFQNLSKLASRLLARVIEVIPERMDYRGGSSRRRSEIESPRIPSDSSLPSSGGLGLPWWM